VQFDGRRITVMGLGHFGGGVAAARWLARQGALVTATDLADEDVLADAMAILRAEPIAQFHLGGHREEDFRHTDLVVVNPAVRPGNPFVQIARKAGVPLTTEIELFLGACRGRVLAVTGSNGKSTTTAMAAAVLRAGGRSTWHGGNLGGSLLDDLPHIEPDHWVALELSSFQLWYLGPETRTAQVAVVTNCTPNHLDWHGTLAHYVAAKQRVLAGQGTDDWAVLNPWDAEVSSWSSLVRGRLAPPFPIDELPDLPVLGHHNRVNAALAAGAATATGCSREAIRAGLESFRPLAQRLELVAVVAGRRFYNDSSATTPESTIAALRSLDGPVWLLAGGSDKRIPFGALADAIVRRARGAAFFGAVRERLREQVLARAADFLCTCVETMSEALDWCLSRSRADDVIVLSPACASHDQFRNFRERGEKFAALVRAQQPLDIRAADAIN